MVHLSINKKIFLVIFISILSFTTLNAIENKILLKINNEIITTIDLIDQANYLGILNPEIKKLENNKIIEIAKNSLIREKVKKIAILKTLNEIELPNEYLEKIITTMYKKIGLNSLGEYEKYVKKNKVKIKFLKEKISIDAIWNEMIFKKFNSKIVINKVKIFNEVVNNPDKELLLSEILFESSNEEQMKIKYKKIQDDIEKEGFKNAASIHSISNTSTNGGDIGWFNQNSLITQIKESILSLKIGQYSKPILTASGFIIIKIEDIRNSNLQIEDIDKKVNNLIKVKTNQQLNQYSNIFYNRVKKDLVINEL